MKNNIAKIIQNYKKYLTSEEKSASTVLKYTHDVVDFLKWNGDAPISKDCALQYKAHLLKTHTITGARLKNRSKEGRGTLSGECGIYNRNCSVFCRKNPLKIRRQCVII